jgi:cytoskeletal protein CcmA (bactofilin family)
VALAGPALAQGRDRDLSLDDQIVLNGELVVPSGETVDTAVILNGPATIEGTVRETLVVFHGDTEIVGTVEGDVVVFSGRLVIRSGARVGGDLVTGESPTVEPGATVSGKQRSIATRFDFAGPVVAGRVAWWIGYTVSTLVLGLLLLLFVPGVDPVLPIAARRQTGASIGIGLAAFFLVPIVAVLLLVTVVAIPLGLFTLLGLALLYTVGYVAGAFVLGRLFVSSSSRFVAFVAGWGVLRLMAIIPILAGFTWLAAAVFGLGVLAVAARRPAGSAASAEAAAITPPPPPMPPAAG